MKLCLQKTSCKLLVQTKNYPVFLVGVLNKSVSSDLTDFPPKAGDSNLHNKTPHMYTHFQ